MADPDAQSTPSLPEEAVGTPQLRAEADTGAPVGPTPAYDFWRALYERRSIRKFKPDPIPRELVAQVIHAGIWAPSSCNYQMWDFVAVDDPAVNARLAALSSQMGNAPVNIVVAYGRDFSEDAWANIQSASAAIENMSLAAHVLGLGTFWITQTGDRELVRETVGLPKDRLVVAVLALGRPQHAPRAGPKRRPLAHVAHWNHYSGKPIPASPRPSDWEPELLAIYQRARVLNGLRHNKPRAWEVRALGEALERLLPRDARAQTAVDDDAAPRWLDVLPCTGIVTERIARERPEFRFDVVERTREVAEFVASRVRPRAGMHAWPSGETGFEAPRDAHYAVVSCFFRLENCPPREREQLIDALARWVAPGGVVLIAFVSARSFHNASEWMRGRRGGLGGVEYVMSPEPNIGPFEALGPAFVERALLARGLVLEARHGAQAAPAREEIEFRTRNFSRGKQSVARKLGWALHQLERLPGVASARGRFQFRAFRR